MSHTCSRRTVAALLVALSAVVALPAAASAKSQDLKVMARNVYLGADLIPLATAPDQAAFEQAAGQRFQTVVANDFPTRAKALAAEIRKAKPDLIGVQEATIWRRGADGVKDGATTPATQVIYDSSKELQKALKAAGSPYREVVGRDWFDFEAPTALNYDVRVTQRDVILVRRGSKVKVRKTFRGGFTNHFDVPTPVGVARQLRGWVGVDATLAKRKVRFVSTHLEAYSPAIANQQMQQLLKSGGPLGSKKRQSILVGDYNSAPGANANDRGTTRKDNAYDSAIKAGFRNNLPKRNTCCFAEDLHSTTDRLETWIDHVLVRPNIKVLKSGIVGTKQIGGLYPSDHAGITATLRLK
ncbi:MAG TPA: endonuclease/exonuclease/phosphatase family protein [Solirubrobacteraceae bacterium]|nr:endonuclease/exonuclease/phosphatase family protein [Solirubrobacteraceae bacterium]